MGKMTAFRSPEETRDRGTPHHAHGLSSYCLRGFNCFKYFQNTVDIQCRAICLEEVFLVNFP